LDMLSILGTSESKEGRAAGPRDKEDPSSGVAGMLCVCSTAQQSRGASDIRRGRYHGEFLFFFFFFHYFSRFRLLHSLHCDTRPLLHRGIVIACSGRQRKRERREREAGVTSQPGVGTEVTEGRARFLAANAAAQRRYRDSLALIDMSLPSVSRLLRVSDPLSPAPNGSTRCFEHMAAANRHYVDRGAAICQQQERPGRLPLPVCREVEPDR
jgi:hypothetical protein